MTQLESRSHMDELHLQLPDALEGFFEPSIFAIDKGIPTLIGKIDQSVLQCWFGVHTWHRPQADLDAVFRPPLFILRSSICQVQPLSDWGL